MIAEAIKKVIGSELLFAESKRDIRKIFQAAERDFHDRNVPFHRRQEVLRELRGRLALLIDRSTDPKSAVLVVEAEAVIDQMLR